MNYRHAFHAGNFADVFKHAIIARILVHLGAKAAPYRVIDTHAGAGLYDLTGAEAQRTGEWHAGIGRLAAASLPAAAHALLAPYLGAIAAVNDGGSPRRYPGSPLLALALMRPQDRLIACELEPGAAGALAHHLRGERRAKAIAMDGWTALNAYIPPRERRGLVIVDPPFEEEDEFSRIAKAVETVHRKWASGIYLFWYPVKDSAPDRLARELKRGGVPRILRTELHTGLRRAGALTGAGVIVVNPPWRLAEEIAVLLPALAGALSASSDGSFIEWLSPEN